MSVKSDLIKFEINKMNMITNVSLKNLGVVRTCEIKSLEEINFKIVTLQRIKENLGEFGMNVRETELEEKNEIL